MAEVNWLGVAKRKVQVATQPEFRIRVRAIQDRSGVESKLDVFLRGRVIKTHFDCVLVFADLDRIDDRMVLV